MTQKAPPTSPIYIRIGQEHRDFLDRTAGRRKQTVSSLARALLESAIEIAVEQERERVPA